MKIVALFSTLELMEETGLGPEFDCQSHCCREPAWEAARKEPGLAEASQQRCWLHRFSSLCRVQAEHLRAEVDL